MGERHRHVFHRGSACESADYAVVQMRNLFCLRFLVSTISARKAQKGAHRRHQVTESRKPKAESRKPKAESRMPHAGVELRFFGPRSARSGSIPFDYDGCSGGFADERQPIHLLVQDAFFIGPILLQQPSRSARCERACHANRRGRHVPARVGARATAHQHKQRHRHHAHENVRQSDYRATKHKRAGQRVAEATSFIRTHSW